MWEGKLDEKYCSVIHAADECLRGRKVKVLNKLTVTTLPQEVQMLRHVIAVTHDHDMAMDARADFRAGNVATRFVQSFS